METAQEQQSEEDRILREWTPVLLRTILTVAAALLIIGLLLMATNSPGYYIRRFHAAQAAVSRPPENVGQIIQSALRGDPHGVMTLGLFVLTLVPLGRVAFCFILFLRQRDFMYVAFTAYVLIMLALGVMLGRIA